MINRHLQVLYLDLLRFCKVSWKVEEYHKGLKLVTIVEGRECLKAKGQKFHIYLLPVFFKKTLGTTGLWWGSRKGLFIQEVIRAFGNTFFP